MSSAIVADPPDPRGPPRAVRQDRPSRRNRASPAVHIHPSLREAAERVSTSPDIQIHPSLRQAAARSIATDPLSHHPRGRHATKASVRHALDESPAGIERAVRPKPTRWAGEAGPTPDFLEATEAARRVEKIQSAPTTPMPQHVELLAPRPVRVNTWPVLHDAGAGPAQDTDREPATGGKSRSPNFARDELTPAPRADTPRPTRDGLFTRLTPATGLGLGGHIYPRPPRDAYPGEGLASHCSSRTVTPSAFASVIKSEEDTAGFAMLATYAANGRTPRSGSHSPADTEATTSATRSPTSSNESPGDVILTPATATRSVPFSPTVLEHELTEYINARTPSPTPSEPTYSSERKGCMPSGDKIESQPPSEEHKSTPSIAHPKNPSLHFAKAKSAHSPAVLTVGDEPRGEFAMKDLDIDEIVPPRRAGQRECKGETNGGAADEAPAPVPRCETPHSGVEEPNGTIEVPDTPKPAKASPRQLVATDVDNLSDALSSATNSIRHAQSSGSFRFQVDTQPNAALARKFEAAYRVRMKADEQPPLFWPFDWDLDEVQRWLDDECVPVFYQVGITKDDHLTRIAAVRQVLVPELREASYRWGGDSQSDWESFRHKLLKHLGDHPVKPYASLAQWSRMGDGKKRKRKERTVFDIMTDLMHGGDAEATFYQPSEAQILRNKRLGTIADLIDDYNRKCIEGDGPGDFWCFKYLAHLDAELRDILVNAMYCPKYSHFRVGRVPWTLYELIEATEEFLAMPNEHRRELEVVMPELAVRLWRYRKFCKSLKYVTAEDFNAHHARLAVQREDAQTTMVRLLHYVPFEDDAAPIDDDARYLVKCRAALVEYSLKNFEHNESTFHREVLRRYDEARADVAEQSQPHPKRVERVKSLEKVIRTRAERLWDEEAKRLATAAAPSVADPPVACAESKSTRATEPSGQIRKQDTGFGVCRPVQITFSADLGAGVLAPPRQSKANLDPMDTQKPVKGAWILRMAQVCSALSAMGRSRPRTRKSKAARRKNRRALVKA